MLGLEIPLVVEMVGEEAALARPSAWEELPRRFTIQDSIVSRRVGAVAVGLAGCRGAAAAVAGSAKPRIARSTRTAVRRRMTRVRDIEHPS
jgi:hypothetical protein